jgi:hypothetical protein
MNTELETMRKTLFASIIESIMYAIIYTRSDESSALSLTNRHQTNPCITLDYDKNYPKFCEKD